jgi:hypothetical protein
MAGGVPRRWYSLGEHPTRARNRRENDPSDENPTIMQTSVTVRLTWARRTLARSTRRRLR